MINNIERKYMKCKFYNNIPKKTKIVDFPSADIFSYATEDAPQIIVRRNPFNQYRTREIITGVPFDTIYTVYPHEYFEHPYLVGVPFKNYTSCIKEDSWLDYEQLEKYINEHKDIEAYRQYLISLKTEALERCEKVVLEEKRLRLEENERVRK